MISLLFRGRSLATLLLGLAWLTVHPPAQGEWLFDADAGALYDNNLTRAQESADVRADGAAFLSASAASFLPFNGSDSLTLSADLSGEAYFRFHGLDVIALGGSARYRHKFGMGPDVPWLLAAATVSYDGYQGDVRTGARYALKAELGKRFTESFEGSLGGIYDRRYQRHDEPVVPGISGKPFDLSGASAYARASYAFDESLLVGARVSVRRGDVESTTRPNREIFTASSAIAPDPTFGPNFFAYRLRGTTEAATLTASWALNDRSSFNVGYSAERTRAYDGLEYRNWVATMSLAYRY